MPTVSINGWSPGFRKVSHTELLRSAAGMSLAQAKDCTDRVLAGDCVTLVAGSKEEARELAGQLVDLGAKAVAIYE